MDDKQLWLQTARYHEHQAWLARDAGDLHEEARHAMISRFYTQLAHPQEP